VAFRRKRIERPKNQLGYALFRFDNIIKKDLKKVINCILKKKIINPKKADVIIDKVFYKLDIILDDISMDNFKTDYMSDKVRYLIIDMVNKFKCFFNKAKSCDFIPEKIQSTITVEYLNSVFNEREKIKKKMKDIESDYL
jgi:hypothetical protein